MLRSFISSSRHRIQRRLSQPLYLTMPKRKISGDAGSQILESAPGPATKKSKTVTSRTKGKGKGKDKAVDPLQYAERTPSLWKVGAHVSAAGGIENAIINASAIGANSFALFVKSQRKWTSPALTESSISSFKAQLVEHGFNPSHILPHGSYLINLGNPDAEKRQKSYDCFLDDLKRCESLGLTLYNFHPGSSVGQATTDEAISLIAECINQAHKETETVVTVLENMVQNLFDIWLPLTEIKQAGAGNIIGGDFSHLSNIISQVDDKTRVGVCLDTCHMFAAGYDLRAKEGWESVIADFDQQIGLSYLRGMHLNDSKTDCGSKRDRHENIGMGYIGGQGFHHILNDVRFQNIPLILETPSFEEPEVWATEIAALNKLSGADLGEVDGLLTDVKVVVKRLGGGSSTSSKPKKAAKKQVTKKGKKKPEVEESDESDEE
ncbi:xylose isomerase-like protein [Mycena sp. CBHHK59/15]|nr:xylose isomerase-like protein [Mycena sp. CBHHK59/15]